MRGLSSSLLQRLQQTLISCGPFDDFQQLRAIFLDDRITIWRPHLPDANSLSKRVQVTIEYLIEKQSITGENALVLFLQVLADRVNKNDACHPRLKNLALALAEEIEKSSQDPSTPFAKQSNGYFLSDFPLDKRPFQAGVEEIQEKLRVLHAQYNQQNQVIPLSELCETLGEMFMRNTFCESPPVCHSQLWSVRFCAAHETLDAITAYKTYLSHRQDVYGGKTLYVEVIQVLSNLIPALRRYCQALTNFFEPPVEFLEARSELRNGRYHQLKTRLDKTALKREDISREVMSQSAAHFNYIKAIVKDFSPFLVNCPEL